VSRLRAGFIVTILLGSMYAMCGLLVSLTDFGVGVAVAAAGVIGWGWVDYSYRREENLRDLRDQVWCRRDNQ
jgi:hypothetical protein